MDASLIIDSVTLAAVQIGCCVLPFGLIAVALRWLEQVVHRPLLLRFGWRSVLWTGWLGTPVHELSHALACIVFCHRIDEMSLFRPDLEAGHLGYVKHSYNHKNLYQQIGNFFIGLAPLLGGTFVLYALLWLFYPEAARRSLLAMAAGKPYDALWQFLELAYAVLGHVVAWENLTTFRFWLFLYLVLCVGCHISPSPGDYRSAARGGLIVIGSLFAANTLFLVCGGDAQRSSAVAATVLGPVVALFALMAVLCAVAAAAVLLLTSLLDGITGRRPRPRRNPTRAS